MPTTPIELLLPPKLDRDAAVALLAKRLTLEPGRPRAEDRLVLDSFDGRLRAAGLRAERPPGRGRGVLTIHEPGAPGRQVEVAAAKRYLASELPDGPVRRRLAEVLEMRALLPVVRLRSSVLPLGGGQRRRQDGGAARDRAGRGGRRLAARRRWRRG